MQRLLIVLQVADEVRIAPLRLGTPAGSFFHPRRDRHRPPPPTRPAWLPRRRLSSRPRRHPPCRQSLPSRPGCAATPTNSTTAPTSTRPLGPTHCWLPPPPYLRHSSPLPRSCAATGRTAVKGGDREPGLGGVAGGEGLPGHTPKPPSGRHQRHRRRHSRRHHGPRPPVRRARRACRWPQRRPCRGREKPPAQPAIRQARIHRRLVVADRDDGAFSRVVVSVGRGVLPLSSGRDGGSDRFSPPGSSPPPPPPQLEAPTPDSAKQPPTAGAQLAVSPAAP